MGAYKKYSLAEVVKHNTLEDCWIALNVLSIG